MGRKKLLWATFAVIFIGTACGLKEKASLKGEKQKSDEGSKLQEPGSENREKLNDFVQATQTAAEEEAKTTGAFDGQAKAMILDPAQPAGPRQQIIDALKMARAKTLEILGISDKPLQELKATLSAIKTLCQPAVEDCRKKAQEAREKFAKQMADMKTLAEKARVEKKDALDKIFEETKNVFMQCDVNAKIMPAGDRKGPVLFGKHTPGYGSPQPTKKAVALFGNGEVSMDIAELFEQVKKGREQDGLSLHGNHAPQPEKPLTDACKQALEKLKAQVTASSK